MKNRFIYLLAAILILPFFSCGKDNGNGTGGDGYELPVPEMVVSNPVPCLEEEVVFHYRSDISANPSWDLGDGTRSSDAIVRHTYAAEGEYKVTLEISDGAGGKAVVDTLIGVAGKSLAKELARLASAPSETWYCAHRGNTYDGLKTSNVPENSIASILKAAVAGAQMVEIDVRTTIDGVPMLMHDATVNRTTNGTGQIAYMTYEQAKALRLKINGVVTELQIPTLEEALLAGRGKVFFNLDLAGYNNNLRKLVELVESLHMIDRVAFYTGGTKDDGNDVVDANRQAIVFPWVSNTQDVSYWSTNKRVGMVQLNYTAATAEGIISAAKKNDMVSYTNSLGAADENMLTGNFTEVDKIRGMGVQIIQTDYVEKLKGHIEK